MTNNVLKLAPTPKVDPNQDLVEQLEKMLVLAREGKVDDFAIAWSDPENYVQSYYIGSPTRCMGLIEYLKFRICAEMREKAIKEAGG